MDSQNKPKTPLIIGGFILGIAALVLLLATTFGVFDGNSEPGDGVTLTTNSEQAITSTEVMPPTTLGNGSSSTVETELEIEPDIQASVGETYEGYEILGSREYIDQPFSSYSVWNMPIHKDAWANGYYKELNLKPLSFRTSSMHSDILYLDPNGEERTLELMELRKAWSSTDAAPWQSRQAVRCDAETTPLPGKVLIPNGWTTEFVGSGKTPDLPTAVLNADTSSGLSVRETQPLEVCPNGKAVTAVDYARVFPIDERGDGRSGLPEQGGCCNALPRGSQGATGLPAMGGLVRRGEFSSGEIRHALKLSLPLGEQYPIGDDNPNAFVWPAHATDSYVPTGYCGGPSRGGDNPYIHSGSQYVLSPEFNMASLESEPGRIIARALRDYGAYVVDTLAPCGGNTNPLGISERTIHVERGPGKNDGTPDVKQEFKNLYGYDMDVRTSSGTTTGFSRDMTKIWADTYVLWHPCHDDRDPTGQSCADYIGGGPTCAPYTERKAPIAPEGFSESSCVARPVIGR